MSPMRGAQGSACFSRPVRGGIWRRLASGPRIPEWHCRPVVSIAAERSSPPGQKLRSTKRSVSNTSNRRCAKGWMRLCSRVPDEFHSWSLPTICTACCMPIRTPRTVSTRWGRWLKPAAAMATAISASPTIRRRHIMRVVSASPRSTNNTLRSTGSTRGPMAAFTFSKGSSLTSCPTDRSTIPTRSSRRFDFIIGSIHGQFKMGRAAQTERLMRAAANPFVTVIGHMTGRQLLRRPGYKVDIERVLAALRRA